MASLTDVCTPRPVGGHYQLDVPSGWRQGRGAFGGLVIAALIRAIEHRMADPARKVRSVTAELPGAVEAGTVDIAVDALRHGKNLSTLRAALTQDGEVRSHAVAILATTRAHAQSTAWNDLTPPEMPSWAEVAPLNQSGIEFSHHFEYRHVDGAMLSGGPARILGWIRPRDPGPARDAAYIAAMADAWWPATFTRLTAPRPMATIGYTLDIVAGVEGLDPMAPMAYRAHVPVCHDGYFLENRELWGGDGRLVALNQQTFAIIQ
jgi:acyl-CoA thioesterase